MRLLPSAPTVLRIGQAESRLLAVLTQGTVPVYRYVPLQAALLSGQDVPFASLWPEYLKLFVYRYAPVPELNAQMVPAELQQHFGRSARNPGGLRPWTQITYRGWPLYYCPADRERGRSGAVPDLFDHVSVDVLPLPPPGTRTLGP